MPLFSRHRPAAAAADPGPQLPEGYDQRLAALEAEGYTAAADAFDPATVEQYAAWLYGHLNAGGQITEAHGIPFAESRFVVAVRDFTTLGETGNSAYPIIVPAGISHLGGELGKSTLYYEAGYFMQGRPCVPVFTDPEFTDLPGAHDLLIPAITSEIQRRANIQYWLDGRAEQARISDLFAYWEETSR